MVLGTVACWLKWNGVCFGEQWWVNFGSVLNVYASGQYGARSGRHDVGSVFSVCWRVCVDA